MQIIKKVKAKAINNEQSAKIHFFDEGVECATSFVVFFTLEGNSSRSKGMAVMSSILRLEVDFGNGLLTDSVCPTGSICSMFIVSSFSDTDCWAMPPSSTLTYELDWHNGLKLQALGTYSLAFFSVFFKTEKGCWTELPCSRTFNPLRSGTG